MYGKDKVLTRKYNLRRRRFKFFSHHRNRIEFVYFRIITYLQHCLDEANEEVTSWIYFFIDALLNIQQQLMIKLTVKGVESRLSPKEKSILVYITDHPGTKSGEIAKNLIFRIRQ